MSQAVPALQAPDSTRLDPTKPGLDPTKPCRRSPAAAARRHLHWPDALTGIRPQLALLTTLACGPLILLLLASAVAERGRVIELAATRTRNLAALGAEQQDDMIQEATTLLRVLSRVQEIRRPHDGPCHELLQRVEEDHKRIGILSVISRDGRVTCNSRDEEPSLDLADRPYFQQAVHAATDDLVLSTPVTSRMTGMPAIIAAVPLFGPEGANEGGDASGQPEAVLIAAMDLDWFSRLAGRLPGAEANLLQIIDVRDGSTLARALVRGQDASDTLRAGALGSSPGNSPEPPVTIRGWDRGLAAAARANRGGGTVEAPDPAGIDRITSFTPLPGTGGNLVLSVGLPRKQVLSEANHRLAMDAAAAVAAAALALMLAWLVANRSLLRPVRRLADAAERLGDGQLDVRVNGLPGAARELHALGRSFDDMTGRLQARDQDLSRIRTELQVSEEHYRLLSSHSSDMIALIDARSLRTYVSPACMELLGYQPEELIGQPSYDLVHPEDLAWMNDTLSSPMLTGSPTARATYRAFRKDGSLVWLESIGRRLPSDAGYVVVTRDVSARMEMEHRLEEANRLLRGQAMQDPLTGLANRRHVDEALGIEFRRAQRLQLPLGILMLDIDYFKAFNDTYGHPAGDICIRAVADAIKSVLHRPTDLAGRYGGEEFAILLPNTDDAGVAVTGERIRQGVQELGLRHSGSPFGIVTVSVGGAAIMPPVGEIGPAAFVEAADAALYAVKRSGRNGMQLGRVSDTTATVAQALDLDQPVAPPSGWPDAHSRP